MSLSNNTYLTGNGRSATQPLGLWLSERYRRLRNGWTQRRVLARQMEELHRSSDRELWDMGLSRSDLPEIAKGTYQHD
jgi:uncharacterized protein YjiS (DUF1127 family)